MLKVYRSTATDGGLVSEQRLLNSPSIDVKPCLGERNAVFACEKCEGAGRNKAVMRKDQVNGRWIPNEVEALPVEINPITSALGYRAR